MSILLTDKELAGILGFHDIGSGEPYATYKETDKAQLKKDIKNILDYGEDRFLEMCMDEVGNGDYRTLLKEIE